MGKKGYRYLIVSILFIVLFFSQTFYADSGGKLSKSQAAYDVNFYDLKLKIDPFTQSIDGSLMCRVKIIESIDSLELDLLDVYTVDSVLWRGMEGDFAETTFSHEGGKLRIKIPGEISPDDIVSALVYYKGTPPVAETPPWDDGFVWEYTPTGNMFWIGVTCEEGGGDTWWPCKDHPTDEPDSMALSFTVPSYLFVASNGKYKGFTDNGDNTKTYRWFVSMPINNYNVTFYASEYDIIKDTFKSVNGKDIPYYFYVLPEYKDTAQNYMYVFKREFEFLESVCGPFPFQTEKLGWAQAPYWGMEHQTIIAYGNNFDFSILGYDYIHLHELAHEWWGNLLTAKDWSDVWIHEGMATYMEALYLEQAFGREAYLEFNDGNMRAIHYTSPLAPRVPFTAWQAFDSLDPYTRGSMVMKTFRFYLGDSVFFNVLKRWLYPDPNDLDNTNGRQCRIVSTEDLKNDAEEITGMDMDTFFEAYLRTGRQPRLVVERVGGTANLEWETEANVTLDLDVPVTVDSVRYVVDMANGSGTLALSREAELKIDPDLEILMLPPSVTSVEENENIVTEFRLYQNYPNPFNPETTIKYSVAENSFVSLKVYDMLGREVKTLESEKKPAGEYEVTFDGAGLASGTYFCRMNAGDYTFTSKLVLMK